MSDVCFFGDGIVMGLGDEAMVGWPGRLAALERMAGVPVTAYNLGVPFDTSACVRARWEHEARARLDGVARPCLVFCFGASDMAERDGSGIRVPLPDSMAHAEAVMRAAAAAWPVLWVGPAPVRSHSPPIANRGRGERFSNARLRALNEAYGAVAARLGVPYLNLMAALDRNAAWAEALAGGTGVYPTADGHQAIAAAVRAWGPWRSRVSG